MLAACMFGILLADAAAVLSAIYWGGLIVGGGLLLVSLLGGSEHGAAAVDTGGDIDLSADADVDLGAGQLDHADADLGHVDAGHAAVGGMSALATWFSLRFLVFFIAVFGALGVILHHLSPLGTWTTFATALGGGLIVGQAVHHLFRYIRQTSGNSTPQPQDYVNRLARVTVRIDPPDIGEVALIVRGGERYVPAASIDPPRAFAVGDQVVVVAYRAGVAQVTAREEFERRPNEGPGETA